MKKTLCKICSLSLALLMLLSFSACQKKAEGTQEEEASKESYKPASEFGVTDYGWISEASFPNHEELENWYEKSKERTSLVYAVFYAKDESQNIWYCWLWAEGYTPATDSMSLSVDNANGTCLHMDITLENEEADSTGAYCFAIPSDTEPTFVLSVNGITEGMIVTLGSKAAIPLIS